MSTDLIRYVGLTIGLLTFFSICRRFYLYWRNDKWHKLIVFSWDEIYTMLENVLQAFQNTEIAGHITDDIPELYKLTMKDVTDYLESNKIKSLNEDFE